MCTITFYLYHHPLESYKYVITDEEKDQNKYGHSVMETVYSHDPENPTDSLERFVGYLVVSCDYPSDRLDFQQLKNKLDPNPTIIGECGCGKPGCYFWSDGSTNCET